MNNDDAAERRNWKYEAAVEAIRECLYEYAGDDDEVDVDGLVDDVVEKLTSATYELAPE